MKIGIQQGLEEIKSDLENKGYQIIEKTEKANVYLYDNYDYNGIFTSFNTENNDGVYMINCHNKTIEEVEQMINNKEYTKIFKY